jgi:transcriptional regulator with XRE-family HTH domain
MAGTAAARPYAALGARLRAARCAAGYSREELGHQLGGVHRDTIGAWERGEWTPGPQNLRILQRLLKLPDLGAELLAGRPAAAAPAAAEGLTVAGWAEVLARGWSAAMLLERLYEVDAEAFGGPGPPAIAGTVAYWAPIYASLPECWRVLVDGAGRVLGYWTFLPLREAAFARVLAGQVLEAELAPEDLVAFVHPGRYRCFVTDLVLRPSARSLVARLLLFRSFLAALGVLARHGMLIETLATNAHSAEGALLARSVGMAKTADHARHPGSEVYAIRLVPLPAGTVFAQDAGLVAAYAQAGVAAPPA